ncbi:MAG: GNAT family N-acetyltransferase [Bacteroidia bacterium]
MELQTPRLLIRPVQQKDAGNIFSGLSNPEVTRYYAVHYDSLEACEAQMKWYRTLEEEEKGYWWVICLKNGGTFIGAGGFNNLDQQNRKAEFGFWLLPHFW